MATPSSSKPDLSATKSRQHHFGGSNDYRDADPAPQSTTAFHSSDAPHTQSTTYQPTTGHDPFAHPKSKDKKELIAAELEGYWTEELLFDSKPHPSVWDAFFPATANGEHCFEILKKDNFYGTVTRQSAVQTNGRRKTLANGWIHMPDVPSKDDKLLEKDITKAFVPIVNRVIASCGLSDTRVAVDGQEFLIKTRDGGWLKPDVFLWGKGSPAFPPIDSKPKVEALRKPRGKSRARSHKGTQKSQKSQKISRRQAAKQPERVAEAQTPTIDWPWCCIPIEVKTALGRGGPSNKGPLVQLGAYAREVLTAQTNRRFVPSLIVTQSTVEFLLWDRAGVLVSKPLDYHEEANALRFCNMLASLVRWEDDQLGFDPTIRYHPLHTGIHIRTSDELEYAVEETLLRSYTLRGRGSTYWRVRRLPDDGSRYIILDSWVKGGKSAENKILRTIEDSRVATGVAPVIHIDDVRWQVQSTASYPDTVRNIRRDFPGDLDLVHTRTVLRCHGNNCMLLERASTPREFMCALHDVVKGLGEMHDMVHIVHRDIAPWNILIQPGAPEGLRGILVDFSCAAFINSGTIPPRPEKTPVCIHSSRFVMAIEVAAQGSHIFRSRESLVGNLASTHLDDLESFYWLFCFLVVGHTGPDLAMSRLDETPGDLLLWLTTERASAIAKLDHLMQSDFSLPVQKWFGEPTARLARNLHGFFYSRHSARLQAKTSGKDLPTPNPPRDYQEFLGWLAQAAREFQSVGEPTDPMINFEEFAVYDSEDSGDNNQPVLVIKESGVTVKRRQLDSDPTGLGPPPKKLGIEMDIGLEGERQIKVFALSLGEITWF